MNEYLHTIKTNTDSAFRMATSIAQTVDEQKALMWTHDQVEKILQLSLSKEASKKEQPNVEPDKKPDLKLVPKVDTKPNRATRRASKNKAAKK